MTSTEKKLKKELDAFSNLQKLAFAASCCERLLPNYAKFQNEENWGDFERLQETLNKIWKMVEKNRITNKEAKELEGKWELVIPDTEDFDSSFTSAALDAATSIYELVMFCSDYSISRILDISTFSLDTVDRHVQDLLNVDYSDPNCEEEISVHPLMVRELQAQFNVIEILKNTTVIDSHLISQLRNQKGNREF